MAIKTLFYGSVAANNNGNFWTGKGTAFISHMISTETPPDDYGSIETFMEYSNETAHAFSEKRFGPFDEIKGLKALYANHKLPRDDYYRRGDYVFTPEGNLINGCTKYSQTTRTSEVYIYKLAYTSESQLLNTMYHEYTHVNLHYLYGGESAALQEKIATYWDRVLGVKLGIYSLQSLFEISITPPLFNGEIYTPPYKL